MAERGGVGGEALSRPVFAGLTIGVSAAFLLCGYELVRSTSNTLFKEAYGKERLPAVMALMPLGVVAALYVYGRLLSWLGPRKTLLATTLLSAAGIWACYAAIRAGIPAATWPLYILREAYVVLLIEQYWSFLNSTLGASAAKKLNGPICGVASFGAVLGSTLVNQLSTRWGTPVMLVLGAASCLPAAVFSEIAYRRCGEPKRDQATDGHRSTQMGKAPGASVGGYLGLGLFRAHPMLAFLLLTIVATQVLSTVLDLSFQGLLQDAIPDRDAQNEYSGLFFLRLNAAAALSQFVLTPLMLRYAPLRPVHIAIPLVHVAACGWLLGEPTLEAAGVAYLLFKALDYSLFRSAKEILYIPFSFDVRYRAKEVIDVFGYRCGKGGTSLLITILQGAGAVFTVPIYAVTAMVSAGAWLAAILPAIQAYRRVEGADAAKPGR